MSAAGNPGELPERVGRYEILLPIAKGGMATVYLARAEGHGGFDRYVALKLTLPHLREDPEFTTQLLEEAKLVAHLRHTNVVPVFDVGQDEHGVFMVMEYVPGDSLAGLTREAIAKERPLPARVALRSLVDALEGLHAAHEHADEDGHPLHLVHRDFSPQNILVATDGVARLTDFGIAKAASRASNTQGGQIKGKMSYLAPEQARRKQTDRRCDLWAAGVVAWEILCRRKLFPPNDPQALVRMLEQDPPRARSVDPEVPAALDEVVASVLKIDPDRRPATAALLARELSAAARDAGMLAETHEVAEHVKALAGPTLAERKARTAAARRRRMGSLPDGIETALGLPPPLISTPRPAPSPVASAPSSTVEPDPAPVDIEISMQSLDVPTMTAKPDLTSVLALEAPRPPKPPELGSLGLPSAPTIAEPDPSEPEILQPLFGAPTRARREWSLDRTIETVLARLPARAREQIERVPRERRAIVLAVAALGVVAVPILVLVLVIGFAGGGGDPPVNAGGTAATETTVSRSLTAPPPTPATTAATPAPATASAPRATDTSAPTGPTETIRERFVALKANAPVTEVRIGARFVDMVIPAPNVNIELLPDEMARALRITARSTDGRVATLELAQGERDGDLAFGAAPPPVAQQPPRVTPPRATAKPVGVPPRRR